MNTFSYVEGNPIGGIDRRGQSTAAIGAAGGFAIGGPVGAIVGGLALGVGGGVAICYFYPDLFFCKPFAAPPTAPPFGPSFCPIPPNYGNTILNQDGKPDENSGPLPPKQPGKEDAQAPGAPTKDEGYVPPKRWDGKKVRNPNGPGSGYPDKNGNVWVPTGPGSRAHGGPHWDVQHPDGSHTNVYPGGKVR